MRHRSELVKISSKQRWQAELRGAKISSSTSINKTSLQRFPWVLGVWPKRKGMCLDTSLLPSLLGVGILIHCLPAPALGGGSHTQKHWAFFGGCQSPSGRLVGCVAGRSPPCRWEGHGSSQDAEESKSTHMREAGVSTYSGQMLVPEAKCPSSRADSLLYFQSHYHFPTPILQNKTLKNTENKSPLTQFWLLFFLKRQWDTLAEEAQTLNTCEPDSTGGLLKKRMRQRWKKHIMEFLLISHVSLPKTFFFFFLLKIKCNSVGLQRFTQTQLRGSYGLS